ncbi:hypothetical protein AA310_12185 [Arthrobacter sp. YC-RL1]|uniref:right-handed parallel beta-helix repeat-containing protein n=1 Tax=Arthrobacter sp. YC-RL1 TaxID=1652545 RepID=UPI00063DD9CB|nr:right-handed parallel beta-helix repeat-containing protein [Arthrobacter sp. YC-RL1]ALQ30126.1 hypothetical protein ATC04_05835 [Arthrobacter sp. YC-RL1]KLI88549.1 hypothetical protein AA310_12185 [Arthrobacter sp. YC-RL1]
MLTEDFEQAQYLSSQVEQARQRAVLAASDAGSSRDGAHAAEQVAREHAKDAERVVQGAEKARDEAQAAADRAEAPTDAMVATLAGNPVSLTRAAVDSATGDMITTEGSTTQAAGDARWVTQTGADILVASEIERTGSEIQVSGDNRWVTNEGADSMVSALFNAPDSAVQVAADNRYSKRGELEVNVRDFGAVGDGVTDDYLAIQAALVASLAIGSRLRIPSGRYLLNDTLRPTANGLHIVCAPDAELINNKPGSILKSNARLEPVKGFDDITIEGGIWNANGLVTGDFTGCIGLGKSKNVIVRDAILKNSSSGHLIEFAGSENVLIDNVRIAGYIDTVGGRDYAEAFQLERITKTGYPDADINDSTPCKNITIQNCTQIDPDTGYSRWPVSVGGHAIDSGGVFISNVKILHNNFGECTYRGIRLQAWRDVVIDGNTVSGPVGFTGATNTEARSDWRITNNNISSTSTHGIWILNARGISLSGNTVKSAGVGIRLEGCFEVDVANLPSVITGGAGNIGVQIITGCDGVTVSGCYLVGSNGCSVQNSVNVRFIGNRVAATANGINAFENTANIAVMNNIFETSVGGRVVTVNATAAKIAISGNVYKAGNSLHNGTTQVTLGTNFDIL